VGGENNVVMDLRGMTTRRIPGVLNKGEKKHYE